MFFLCALIIASLLIHTPGVIKSNICNWKDLSRILVFFCVHDAPMVMLEWQYAMLCFWLTRERQKETVNVFPRPQSKHERVARTVYRARRCRLSEVVNKIQVFMRTFSGTVLSANGARRTVVIVNCLKNNFSLCLLLRKKLFLITWRKEKNFAGA